MASALSSPHELQRYCRVCAGFLQRGKRRELSYNCSEHHQLLQNTFCLDVTTDRPSAHPPKFCNRCYAVTQRHCTAAMQGRPYQHSVTVLSWKEHSDEHCNVCNYLTSASKARGGGHNKKTTKKRGRPCGQSITDVIEHIKTIAPPPLCTPDTNSSHLAASLQCPICSNILSQPIELHCGSLVCADCCCRWLQLSVKLDCPCCYNHQLSKESLRSPPQVILNLLSEITTQTVTIADILATPCNTPTSHVERQVANSLVKRIIKENEGSVIKLPNTRGKPLTLMAVSQQNMSQSAAPTKKTVNRRLRQVQVARSTIGVGLEDEVKVLPKQDRQKLLQDALPLEIPAEHTLAMKTSLGISWTKLRTLRRWLKTFNVSLASERRQRALASAEVGENLAHEMVPFSFSKEGGGVWIKEVPFVYVPNLIAKVSDRLMSQQRCTGFTWHNGFIPADELWLKLGGDKGHGSFKFTLQIMNVQHPNSIKNTTLLAVYRAGDSLYNLHTALDQFKEQVKEMDGMKWSSWKLRIFIAVDYEFLTAIYGLSGASGRHCCLWCKIRSCDLKIPLATRRHSEARSLQSLKSDHNKFMLETSGDIKRAKEYFNCIGEPFFSIPIQQVSMPGLHLSLGIFNRLYELLEDTCEELDLQLASKTSTAIGGSSFQRYAEMLKQLTQLRTDHEAAVQKQTLLTQLLSYLLVSVTAPDDSLAVTRLRQEPASTGQHLSVLASEITAKNAELSKKFVRKDGPFYQSLEEALKKLHVQRQAYHGGTFVGNHVHKLVQESNANILCSGVVEVAENCSCAELIQPAKLVQARFLKALTLFGKCHNLYNGSTLSDKDIGDLDTNIKEFLKYYRESFPHASILPKMHILEDHMVDWVKKWRIGAGLLGEQGAESIHAHMNRLDSQFCGIVNPLDRLKYIVREQNLEASPSLNMLQPPPKKYKKHKD